MLCPSPLPVQTLPRLARAGIHAGGRPDKSVMKIQEYLSQEKVSRHPVIISYLERNAIPDSEREAFIPAPLATVAKVAAGVIKRISLPATKAKGKDGTVKQAGSPRTLSVTDCEDVIGIVSDTLASRDAFSRPIDSEDWNACFQASRAKVTGLNLNNDKTFDHADYITRSENQRLDGRRNFVSPRDSKAIERRFRYLRECLKLAFGEDTSRKRVAKFSEYSAMLELSRKYMIGKDTGFHSIAPGLVSDLRDLYACEMNGAERAKVANRSASRRMFVMRFREYLAIGESVYEEEALTFADFA